MKAKTNIFNRTSVSKWLYRSSKIGITGRFVCDKNEEPIFYQSYLELGVLRYLALDNSVKFIDSQQGTMKWQPRNSKLLRTYTPDIITIDDNGEITFTEVKPKAKLNPTEQSRLEEIRDALHNAGYSFEIKTDEDVPYETFVNCGQLLNAENDCFEPSFLEVVVYSLSMSLPDRFTLKQLQEKVEAFRFPICHYGLIKAGYFSFNMKKLLTPTTPVWRVAA